MREPSKDHDPDRGQATMLLLGCVAFVAVVAVGAGALGVRIVARQRAQVAADAAALAGVTSGRSGASALATANGARLVTYAQEGDDVVVVAAVGDERAKARATDGP
ncbi:MAG: hypothetical protein QM733_04680 [Ilumatobacteraceae bacterium]